MVKFLNGQLRILTIIYFMNIFIQIKYQINHYIIFHY
jgi:hypothetical protein